MKVIKLLVVIGFVGVLAGCASSNLKAPCPNFGRHCQKTPINSWDYRR